MTIVESEVSKSVYVGGLPYDTTEHFLRKTFSDFGQVIHVKINNEGVGGKCYGFVTFTNPRSAVDAIKNMNGRTIGGRVVRVNEVKAKGDRADNSREGFRRNFERSLTDRNRDRDRQYASYEDRHQTHKRDRSEDRSRDRERVIFRQNNYGQARDHSLEKEREQGEKRSMEEDNKKQEQGWDQYSNSNREVKRSTRHLKSRIDDKDEESDKLNGSRFSDQRTRDHSSESWDNDYEVEETLKAANQALEELHEQVSQLEESVDKKQQLVSELQAEAQNLEDALTAARKLSSQRRMQLVRLSKSYLQMKNYNEKLKSSEQELQSFVDTTTAYVDDGNDLRFDDDVSTYERS